MQLKQKLHLCSVMLIRLSNEKLNPMRKIFVAGTLFLFLGALTVSSYAMYNGTSVEWADKSDKKRKKNKKGEMKSCSSEEKKSCSSEASGSQPKSCCSAKKAES